MWSRSWQRSPPTGATFERRPFASLAPRYRDGRWQARLEKRQPVLPARSAESTELASLFRQARAGARARCPTASSPTTAADVYALAQDILAGRLR